MTETIQPGSDRTLELFSQRVQAAVNCGTHPLWGTLRSRGEATVVVGAGGSYPAADFLARLLREQGTAARSAWPLDAGGPEQRMVAITYSGETPDIDKALRAHRTNGGRAIIITGNPSPPVATDKDIVLCHRNGNTGETWSRSEQGFISFAGTVAPCASALAGIGSTTTSEILQTLDSGDITLLGGGDLIQVLDEAVVLDVFASGWGWPAALDIESKWVESGLQPVRLHETKNFSHGRYISVLDQNPQNVTSVLFFVGQPNRYEKALKDVLVDHGQVILVACDLDGASGGLGVLAKTQPVCAMVGKRQNLDVSRPDHIPEDGRRLHRWTWD